MFSLNGSHLPSTDKDPRFPFTASNGHTLMSFQVWQGPSRIRTPPYTPTRSRTRARERDNETSPGFESSAEIP